VVELGGGGGLYLCLAALVDVSNSKNMADGN
jgi:hypothetical protein